MIKAEFERLHLVLHQEEAKRLEALSIDEQEKIESMQRMIKETEREMKELKTLIDTLKKEMGNEDLALLKVTRGSLFYHLILSFFFFYCKACFKSNFQLIPFLLSFFMLQNFQNVKRQ